MGEQRHPKIDTEAWFKELENRLDRVRAALGDAEIKLSRSMSSKARLSQDLSIVQEMIAKLEDRLGWLIATATGESRGNGDTEAPPVVYREIPGFPGYRAGSDGTVWGSRRAGRGYGRTREWRPLKPYLMRPGPAPTVSLYRDRVRHSMRVDAVILLAFAGERPEEFEVKYENGDFLDDRLENLRDSVVSNPSADDDI